jgi:hypothetical protein
MEFFSNRTKMSALFDMFSLEQGICVLKSDYSD